MLLTRQQFRERVFERDNYCCVICQQTGQDAHHIIERRLWDNGGYYLDNGATLCNSCHIKAEQTVLSCEEIREASGITNIILPDHLYNTDRYTKWGDIITSNGIRIPSELFYDESVQKILNSGQVLHLYNKYIKYPRTFHLPWSPGTSSEDRLLKDDSQFLGKEIIVIEKMDGENTSLYRDYCHSRSINSDSHSSRDWIKAFHSEIKYNIPEGWRICGENLYAKHSIHYNSLSSYFLVFNIWNEKNTCLSWRETEEWCKLLNLELVPTICRGIYSREVLKTIERNLDIENTEGYIIRLADSFNYSMFRKSVAKYVRPNHIRTSEHWKTQPIIKNLLV